MSGPRTDTIIHPFELTLRRRAMWTHQPAPAPPRARRKPESTPKPTDAPVDSSNASPSATPCCAVHAPCRLPRSLARVTVTTETSRIGHSWQSLPAAQQP
ncbi:hypothetical protein ACWC5I_48040, partial [Kitasatospora sp. NPDC001574]